MLKTGPTFRVGVTEWMGGVPLDKPRISAGAAMGRSMVPSASSTHVSSMRQCPEVNDAR